jgi:hypothetical protein
MLKLTNLQPNNIELSSQEKQVIKGGINSLLLNDSYWRQSFDKAMYVITVGGANRVAQSRALNAL